VDNRRRFEKLEGWRGGCNLKKQKGGKENRGGQEPLDGGVKEEKKKSKSGRSLSRPRKEAYGVSHQEKQKKGGKPS